MLTLLTCDFTTSELQLNGGCNSVSSSYYNLQHEWWIYTSANCIKEQEHSCNFRDTSCNLTLKFDNIFTKSRQLLDDFIPQSPDPVSVPDRPPSPLFFKNKKKLKFLSPPLLSLVSSSDGKLPTLVRNRRSLRYTCIPYRLCLLLPLLSHTPFISLFTSTQASQSITAIVYLHLRS